MRLVIMCAVVAECVLHGQTAAPAGHVDTFRAAIAAYAATGNAAEAVKPLLGFQPGEFDSAVQAVLHRAEPKELEAAAVLQLEIGIATVGLSAGSALQYLEHGSTLINAVMPPAAIRKGLSAERLQEIEQVSSMWHVVAASALLSVNEGLVAQQFIRRALRTGTNAAAVSTLLGAIEEVVARRNDGSDWDALFQITRANRERLRLLLRAELAYKDAMKADPQYPLAPIRMGRVEFLRGNFKAAGSWLERGTALAREPRHRYLAAMFTGALQEAQHDLAGARASFERALAIMPESQDAVVALSFVELMSGRVDRAQHVAQSYTSRPLADAWWVFKTGTFDIEGLQRLRARVRR